ncbi:OsmC family protein [Thermodesulfovibrionales bacterium]|nr:OsmC family protein [Thermodesulfovibrionales bacterium]MCL0047178.1 OsmC family protein [Thermodesulfovibrionales bacterium]MCL0062213.1 OsmC family protein [Thermodesulfovibrionales bacterium]MCL0068737.1 OsmC family protein [Thermodesulfovibrionales bacterium]MCL0071324.1 OsmC family protein [Thermodesulfovibrionales bacterium]
MLQAAVKWVDGLQFVGNSGTGHAIVVDGEPVVGGKNTGMRPTELLLVGLGGCAGMDIISILQKEKQQVASLEINVKGQKAAEHPKKITEMEIEFVITGKDLSEEAIKKAVELSMEKYCSVKATLEGVAKISFSYQIL